MQLDAAEVSKIRLPSKYGVSMFSVAKPIAVPDTRDEELRKGRGGDASEAAGGAAEEAGAVGGNKFEAVKNNGEDKYPFARRSSVWRNSMYAKVKVEFNSLLIDKGVENPADYCIKAFSACDILKGHKKCQSGMCKRKHKIPEDALDAITSLDLRKTLLLYYKFTFSASLIDSRVKDPLPRPPLAARAYQVTMSGFLFYRSNTK